MAPQASRPVEVFISYSHKDDELRDQLETSLSTLWRAGVVRQWSDRGISPGEEWDKQIDERLESADIILLLVSPDFLASDYCYDREVERAMQRHRAGEARVIPVILRHCDNWQAAPFGKLLALPRDGRPVKDWPDRDKAFAEVAAGIRGVVAELGWVPGKDFPAPTAWRVIIPRRPSVGFVPRRDKGGRDIVGRLVKGLAPGRDGRVMLSGPGGVGKTTLAAEAARKLEDAYPGRVVWSDAAGREDYTPSSLFEDITIKLGGSQPHRRPDDEKEAEANKLIAGAAPTLIILDSYEDIGAAERRHIERWFEKSPCSALFVSQELTTRLDLNSVIRVPFMRPPEALKLLGALIKGRVDSPKIFTKGVRYRVLASADGNPSALQLIVPLIDFTQCPAEVLEALKRVEGEHAERAFERAFNHAFDLPQLGDDGRAALLALSLFRQGATQEALAHVTGFGPERRLEAVSNLTRLSLLKPAEEDCRLRLENLTRRLARAALDRDERAVHFKSRFVEYFREFVRREKWPANADLGIVEAERSNIVAAMRLASDWNDWDTVLEFFDVTLNHVNTFAVWKRSVVAAEGEAEDRFLDEAQRPPLLIEINHRHENRPQARGHYQGIPKKLALPAVPSYKDFVGLKLPRKKKWTRQEKWRLVVLSVAAFELGVCAHYRAGESPPEKRHDKYERSRDYFEAAKQLKSAFKDDVGYAIACNNIGVSLAVERPAGEGVEGWKKRALKELKKGRNKLKERLRLGKAVKFEKVVERNIEWVKGLKE